MRASPARLSLRACRVTACPWPARMTAAMSPRPSADPVMSTRATTAPFFSPYDRLRVRQAQPRRRAGISLRTQVLAGGVHQLQGMPGTVADEFAVALDDIAADDDRFHISGSRAEDHDGDRVAEAVEVRRPHVDDRDVGLLAGCQGADLVLKMPDTGAVDGGEPQHVPLVEIHGRDHLVPGDGGRVGPGPF